MNSLYTILLLVASNVFMTLAWYGHLKMAEFSWFKALPLIGVIALSWGIAFFEYILLIPANRIAHEYFTIGQLKILQEALTLSVFIPMLLFVFKEEWKWDYLWSFLCLLGAVFFAFRSKIFD